jgi:2-oxoglutarate ferredoxin oxidoreductase subunit alpha
MPTRSEQGDLDFVLSASHGEFPRIILAPGSVEECFTADHRAFNLAEKYQTPVIIMTDLYQAFALKTVARADFDFAGVSIDRGKIVSDEELDALSPDKMYVRHKLAEDGVSTHAIPGHPRGVYMTTGDKHTKRGFITESQSVRIEQMDKRMQKLETARADILPPELHGLADADITLVRWGSTRGAIREAVDRLNADGQRANSVHFADVWPLPEGTVAALESADYLVAAEQNFSGQFAGILRRATGINCDHRILKYDSKQVTPDDIVAAVAQEVSVRV